MTVMTAPRMIPRTVSSLMLSSVLSPCPSRAIPLLPFKPSNVVAVRGRRRRRVPPDRLPVSVDHHPDVGQKDAVLDHPPEILQSPLGLDRADHHLFEDRRVADIELDLDDLAPLD